MVFQKAPKNLSRAAAHFCTLNFGPARPRFPGSIPRSRPYPSCVGAPPHVSGAIRRLPAPPLYRSARRGAVGCARWWRWPPCCKKRRQASATRAGACWLRQRLSPRRPRPLDFRRRVEQRRSSGGKRSACAPKPADRVGRRRRVVSGKAAASWRGPAIVWLCATSAGACWLRQTSVR
jgi:hypothetical protein